MLTLTGKQTRPVRRGNYYRPRNYNSNYAMFFNGIQPRSTVQIIRYQRMAMTPIINDNHSYIQSIKTAGNNNPQMSNNNKRGQTYTAWGEFFDNAVTNFEFAKFVFYKQDGKIENKTEIRLLNFEDRIRQSKWEADYKKLTEEIGLPPTLNPSDVESLEEHNEYQKMVRDKIGTSPEQEIMKEYFLHPENFKQTYNKTEVVPEFRQGE